MKPYRGGRPPIRSVRCAVRPKCVSILKRKPPFAHESAWVVDRKEFLQQSSCFDETFLGKGNGLSFSSWVGNKSLFVQTVHSLPVVAFPGPSHVMKPKIQQGQNGSVDLVIVQSHWLSG